MSQDLLIEIGVEELPTSFLNHALSAFEAGAREAFEAARLAPSAIVALGTPRRLTLRVEGLPEQQPDRRESVQGPPWAAAFDASGTPKPAAIGFAKKQGVDVGALEGVDTDKGRYVVAQVFEEGRAAKDVLPEIIAAACAKISFPKSMRWGAGDFAFGRPIHWLVGLLGEDVLPFEFAGLSAGRTTRGHRFLSPESFEITSASTYEAQLGERHVVVSVAARKKAMHDALMAAASAAGGVLADDEFLLEECTSLVEEPFVVPGTIEARFLELPDAVVVSVMRDHQRYFAVRDAEGALSSTYLNVVNTALSPETIAKGNDRVLRARLADAEFFVREDRKISLRDRLPRLDNVTFQKKLGSVGEKVRRNVALARALAGDAGVTEDQAAQAAELAKADLDTLIVFEFPELQGLMGRYYAKREGIADDIADAIADHYKPVGASDAPSESALACVVSVADRADTLVGCFGIGLVPSGSADPFALRRATLGIIRIALEGAIDVNLSETLARAYASFPEGVLAAEADVLAKLDDFARGRLRAFYRENFSGEIADACLGAWEGGSIRDLDARVRAMAAFRKRDEYEALAKAFKRAQNITKDAERQPVDPARFVEDAERALGEVWAKAKVDIAAAAAEARYEDGLEAVANELAGPIDRFFDDVLVMDEDDALRQNRLSLLAEIADTVSRIAHLHVLSK